ncbi:MAG: hypothetical protein KA765_04800 [Thermoflexales bacterium]|nr:hypothetical protein [Thermoflexales bacterium]
MTDQTKGLTCPSCASAVPVPDGARIVTCPACQQKSLVQGERGVRRWQVRRKVDRAQAVESVTQFFGGLNKAIGLKQQAQIQEVFLVYLPFWRVDAYVAGWRLGREKSGDDSSRPVEVEVLDEMQWADAAADVSEFGVQRIAMPRTGLEPFNQDVLSREGMVFEPSESWTEAAAEAADHFTFRAREKKTLKTSYYEKFHILREKLSIVYYPLWVARYHYRKRNYQVVVDGVHNKVLYGKAPGNILYRAAALVGGMSIGNLLLVHGTAFAFQALAVMDSSDSDAWWFLFLPTIIGIVAMAGGYRAFRYGEEVEQIDKDAKKAATTKQKSDISSVLESGGDMLGEVTRLLK